MCLTIIFNNADPSLELSHRLVELAPFQRHILQLDAASIQRPLSSFQTLTDLTHCNVNNDFEFAQLGYNITAHDANPLLIFYE